MFKVKNIEDLELVYSILREQNPNNQIDITFNWNIKEYTINVSDKKYKNDPEVPLDLNIEVIYGDSVTGDTPLLLKRDNKIYIETIESIFNENEKFKYPEFKIFDKSIRLEKEYSLTDYKVWSDIGWVDINKVIKHKCNKKIYRVLTHIGCVDVTEDHSLIQKNMREVKPIELKIGQELLHSFPNIFENHDFSFISNKNEIQYKFTDKLSAQRAYYILKSQGYNVNIKTIKNRFILVLENNTLNNSTEVIYLNKIENEKSQFVYDLETPIGRFNAGIGEMTIHNTDSIFINFKYNRDDFLSNRRDTFNLATLAGDKLTNEIFNRPPIEMEFEKVFQPFVLLTKKRYIGKKFENPKDPFQLKTIDSKGIALTRRDYCKLVKDCYKTIIDVIMENNKEIIENKDKDIDILEKSINVFKNFCDKIDKYKADDQDLCISAMLAKEFLCSLCKKKTEWSGIRCECKCLNSHLDNYCNKCKSTPTCKHVFSLAHVNLAVNLLKRREDVQVNDRIQYIFVEAKDPKQKKGELAEDPIWAKRLGLKFNRLCYLEQLAKPILGLYKVLLQNDSNRLDDLIDWVNKRIESYGGKKLKPADFKIDE